MTRLIEAIKRGLKQGFKTTWILGKIIVPVYIAVWILQRSFLIESIDALFEPLMKYFGLPGEASIVLVLGNLVNIYAALGALAAFKLSAAQITVLSVMLSFSHTLLVETAVTKRIGVSAWLVVTLRLASAAVFGFVSANLLGIG